MEDGVKAYRAKYKRKFGKNDIFGINRKRRQKGISFGSAFHVLMNPDGRHDCHKQVWDQIEGESEAEGIWTGEPVVVECRKNSPDIYDEIEYKKEREFLYQIPHCYHPLLPLS